MAEVKWIKITTNMFDDEKIDFIESLPEADAILVVWIKLLTMAGKINSNGFIFLTEQIPYTPEMLAHRFRRPFNTVKLALETLKNLEMISFDEAGFLNITNWEKHQNIEGMDKIREQNRLRKQKQRDKEKQVLLDDSHVTVTPNHAIDIDIELDKDIDKDIYIKDIEQKKEKPKKSPPKLKYGEYENVLLTKDEYQKLENEMPNYLEMIERLSGYVASTGKKYVSHYATIKNWSKKDQNQKPRQAPIISGPKEIGPVEKRLQQKRAEQLKKESSL